MPSKHDIRLGMVFAALLAPTVAGAQTTTWAVARASVVGGGACYIGRPPFMKPIADQYDMTLIDGLSSRKMACASAKGLYSSDPTNEQMCYGYASINYKECKNDGVILSRPK